MNKTKELKEDANEPTRQVEKFRTKELKQEDLLSN